jgi:hypothetical protein
VWHHAGTGAEMLACFVLNSGCAAVPDISNIRSEMNLHSISGIGMEEAPAIFRIRMANPTDAMRRPWQAADRAYRKDI